jgi:hypothetical protein
VFPGLVVLFNPGTTTSQLDQLIASDPRFNLISLEGGSRLWYSVVVSGFRKDKVIEQLNNELSVIATGEIPESSLAKFE